MVVAGQQQPVHLAQPVEIDGGIQPVAQEPGHSPAGGQPGTRHQRHLPVGDILGVAAQSAGGLDPHDQQREHEQGPQPGEQGGRDGKPAAREHPLRVPASGRSHAGRHARGQASAAFLVLPPLDSPPDEPGFESPAVLPLSLEVDEEPPSALAAAASFFFPRP